MATTIFSNKTYDTETWSTGGAVLKYTLGSPSGSNGAVSSDFPFICAQIQFRYTRQSSDVYPVNT